MTQSAEKELRNCSRFDAQLAAIITDLVNAQAEAHRRGLPAMARKLNEAMNAIGWERASLNEYMQTLSSEAQQ